MQGLSQPGLTQTQEISPEARSAEQHSEDDQDEDGFAVINLSDKKWKKRKLNNGVSNKVTACLGSLSVTLARLHPRVNPAQADIMACSFVLLHKPVVSLLLFKLMEQG